MTITTTYKNVNGTPKVVAKGFGRQRTVNWDLSKSTDWNHGTAAGALLLAVPENPFSTHILAHGFDTIAHDSNDAGTVHRFMV